jgi:serine/threonine protein kinase
MTSRHSMQTLSSMKPQHPVKLMLSIPHTLPPPDLPTDLGAIDTGLAELVCGLLDPNPQTRCTIEQARLHSFVRQGSTASPVDQHIGLSDLKLACPFDDRSGTLPARDILIKMLYATADGQYSASPRQAQSTEQVNQERFYHMDAASQLRRTPTVQQNITSTFSERFAADVQSFYTGISNAFTSARQHATSIARNLHNRARSLIQPPHMAMPDVQRENSGAQCWHVDASGSSGPASALINNLRLVLMARVQLCKKQPQVHVAVFCILMSWPSAQEVNSSSVLHAMHLYLYSGIAFAHHF